MIYIQCKACPFEYAAGISDYSSTYSSYFDT